MDFMNRGFRNGQNTTNNMDQPAPVQTVHANNSDKKFGRRKNSSNSKFSLKQAGGLTFLLALVVIVAGVVFAMINFKGSNPESKLVDTSKYQAVFLNGGQVYFGNIKDLNSKYLRLNNIYYLRVNQQVQPDGNAAQNPNDVSLVKLGCELHGPEDAMVINREQVVFWENLKNDGQVLKAMDEYRKQFPNGEDCTKQSSTNSSSNSESSSNNTSTNSTTPTTNSTTPTTTNTTR